MIIFWIKTEVGNVSLIVTFRVLIKLIVSIDDRIISTADYVAYDNIT